MLTELRNWLKSEQKNQNIFDIVLYGSAVKGKLNPRDLDVVVVFRSGSLKERLDEIQKIKTKIKTKITVDIKGILWEELFQEEFFARSGIFLEGISLFSGEPFSKKIGYNSKVLFFYDLQNKNHNEKVKFNYLLSGRKGKGILKKINAIRLTPGVIEVSVEQCLEFEEVLKLHQISYIKKLVLLQS